MTRGPWLALALSALLAGGAAAQDVPEPADPTAPPPTLDELLGIEEADTDGAREAAAVDAEDELSRQLKEAEITDAFVAAIGKMGLSADFLDREFDPGLGTQRIQEEIIQKLDEFIDLAKQQQQKQSGSPSSSSSQKKPPKQTPDKQQSEQQKQDSPNNPGGASEPPPMQQGDINTVLEENRTEWGGLPPRHRDELLQGRSDRYSSLYEQLTREYYRRLAEEGS